MKHASIERKKQNGSHKCKSFLLFLIETIQSIAAVWGISFACAGEKYGPITAHYRHALAGDLVIVGVLAAKLGTTDTLEFLVVLAVVVLCVELIGFCHAALLLIKPALPPTRATLYAHLLAIAGHCWRSPACERHSSNIAYCSIGATKKGHPVGSPYRTTQERLVHLRVKVPLFVAWIAFYNAAFWCVPQV
jgi:hypothetical protein